MAQHGDCTGWFCVRACAAWLGGLRLRLRHVCCALRSEDEYPTTEPQPGKSTEWSAVTAVAWLIEGMSAWRLCWHLCRRRDRCRPTNSRPRQGTRKAWTWSASGGSGFLESGQRASAQRYESERPQIPRATLRAPLPAASPQVSVAHAGLLSLDCSAVQSRPPLSVLCSWWVERWDCADSHCCTSMRHRLPHPRKTGAHRTNECMPEVCWDQTHGGVTRAFGLAVRHCVTWPLAGLLDR